MNHAETPPKHFTNNNNKAKNHHKIPQKTEKNTLYITRFFSQPEPKQDNQIKSVQAVLQPVLS